MKSVKAVLVGVLWLMPAWLVWQVSTQSELQTGLNDLQLGVLIYYPLIAVLMLFFATVLYRRLPTNWFGLGLYIVGTLVLPALHWWLGKTDSLKILLAEWATFSLTIFVLGFTVELLRRIYRVAREGHWILVVLGGLANIALFVVPGILISVSCYAVLYHHGVFQGGWLLQTPYLLALIMAVWHEWRAFRAI